MFLLQKLQGQAQREHGSSALTRPYMQEREIEVDFLSSSFLATFQECDAGYATMVLMIVVNDPAI